MTHREGPKPHEPLTLPCGVTLANRIAKAAMTEGLADPSTNAPNMAHVRLYEAWGKVGAGLLVTGNVMVDRAYLEAPGNVAIENDDHLPLLQQWAAASQAGGSVTIVQLSHPGRQCPISITSEPLCPSANPSVKAALPLFASSRELTVSEIESINLRFINAAHVVYRAGFGGVQLHCAHGYLLSQFLSPKTNRRDDKYGGSPDRRRYLLHGLIKSIRSITSPNFMISVKLNSADFQKGGLSLDESLDVVEMLEADGIDLLEVSGGTYEDAAMINGVDTGGAGELPKSSIAREAFFLSYVQALRCRFPELTVPVMLTGGFRSGAGMVTALSSGNVDVVGLGRPFATEPSAVARLVAPTTADADLFTLQLPSPKLGIPGLNALDAGIENLWHQKQIQLISQGGRPDMNLNILPCLGAQMFVTYVWNPKRSSTFGYVKMGVVCTVLIVCVGKALELALSLLW